MAGEEVTQRGGRLAGRVDNRVGYPGRLGLVQQRGKLEHVLHQPFGAAHPEQRLTADVGRRRVVLDRATEDIAHDGRDV